MDDFVAAMKLFEHILEKLPHPLIELYLTAVLHICIEYLPTLHEIRIFCSRKVFKNFYENQMNKIRG